MYTTCKKLNFNLYTAYELEGWSFIQASIRIIEMYYCTCVFVVCVLCCTDVYSEWLRLRLIDCGGTAGSITIYTPPWFTRENSGF